VGSLRPRNDDVQNRNFSRRRGIQGGVCLCVLFGALESLLLTCLVHRLVMAFTLLLSLFLSFCLEDTLYDIKYMLYMFYNIKYTKHICYII
jgi:hypothetical protein